jgi:hypothetical protein
MKSAGDVIITLNFLLFLFQKIGGRRFRKAAKNGEN